MKRLQTFYTWHFLMPIFALALVDLLTFYLPAKSSEKITLSLFVFVSIGVLTRLFNESMPSTSENISIFGTFLWIHLLISGLIIIVSIVSMTLYHRKSPKCISTCCTAITNIFKCKSPTCCKNSMDGQPKVIEQTCDVNDPSSSNEETEHVQKCCTKRRGKKQYIK